MPCKIATFLFEPNLLNVEFLFEFGNQSFSAEYANEDYYDCRYARRSNCKRGVDDNFAGVEYNRKIAERGNYQRVYYDAAPIFERNCRVYTGRNRRDYQYRGQTVVPYPGGGIFGRLFVKKIIDCQKHGQYAHALPKDFDSNAVVGTNGVGDQDKAVYA